MGRRVGGECISIYNSSSHGGSIYLDLEFWTTWNKTQGFKIFRGLAPLWRYHHLLQGSKTWTGIYFWFFRNLTSVELVTGFIPVLEIPFICILSGISFLYLFLVWNCVTACIRPSVKAESVARPVLVHLYFAMLYTCTSNALESPWTNHQQAKEQEFQWP